MTGITNENESRNVTPYRDRQKLSRESTPQTDSSPRPSLQMKHVNASSVDTVLSDPKKHTATPEIKSSSVKTRSSMSPLSSPLRERFSINIYPEFEADRQSPNNTEHAIKKPTRHEAVKSTTAEAKPEKTEEKENSLQFVLVAKVAAAKNTIKEMQQQLKHARAERQRKQTELESLKREISGSRDKLEALAAATDIEDQNEDMIKDRLAALQDEIDENRSILEEAEKIKQDGQEELEEQENEIVLLMNEIPEKMVEADDLRALLGK